MPPSSLIGLSLALALAGCATHVQKPEHTQNPPPSVTFNEFSQFELKPVNQSEGCQKAQGGDKLIAALNQRLPAKLNPMLHHWKTAAQHSKRGKLVIEPICANAKLIGTATRIFAGPLAGSSAVVIKVRYTDAASGQVIAEPSFYQRTAAMSGAYTFGATDNAMLSRIVNLVAGYTENNYAQFSGGPTGTPDAN